MIAGRRSRTAGRGVAVIAGICVLAVITVLIAVTRPPARPAPASGVPRSECVGVVVVSSQEKSDLLKQLAGEYDATHPTQRDQCVDVRVNSMASGAAERALAAGWNLPSSIPRPVVWSPAASSWLGILGQDTRDTDDQLLTSLTAESLMQSPLVLAMPRPMAEALGWPDHAVGWADLLKLAQDPRGWGAYGHPGWGPFKLGKTSPAQSTSGLHALLAAYYAATGVSADLTEQDVNDPRVQRFVGGVETSVLHYSTTVSTFFEGLRAADAQGAGMTYVSAIATEEQQVLAYNRGNPATPLVAVYPSDGTMVADHPYAILKGPSVTSDQRVAAAAFLSWLLAPDRQRRFLETGFRDHAGHAAPALTTDSGIVPAGPALVLKPPAPAVLDLVRRSWDPLRKRARVLIVLDVSGSMAGDKLDNVRKAAISAVKAFAPDDEVGLWSFSTAITRLQPVAPVATGGPKVVSDIGRLTAGGGTALYRVTREAVAAVQVGWDPARINAVLLMTDGQNEELTDNNLDALLKGLGGQSSATTVPVFTIGYGADADLATLKRISLASHGRTYNAPDPAHVADVFADVVSNF